MTCSPARLWLVNTKSNGYRASLGLVNGFMETQTPANRDDSFGSRQPVLQLLKRERVKRKTYASRAEAREDIFDYVELFYNPVRRHSYNNGLSPVVFERQYQARWASVWDIGSDSAYIGGNSFKSAPVIIYTYKICISPYIKSLNNAFFIKIPELKCY